MNPRIIIPTARANGSRMLSRCLESIVRNTIWSIDIDVVYSSSPGTAMNDAVQKRYGDGADLVFIDDDVEIMSWEWISIFREALECYDAQVAVPLLLYPDGRVFYAAGVLDENYHPHFHNGESLPLLEKGGLCTFAPFTFMYVTRQAWDTVGPVDPLANDCQYNDLDWCVRANKAGVRMVYVPSVLATHIGRGTYQHQPTFAERAADNLRAFNAKWGTKL